MPNENTTPIPSLGEYRQRQKAAKDRAEARIAPPDVRAARAAALDRREAGMAAGREEANQKANRPAEVYRETLALVPDELLYELQRGLSTLSTRTMADIVSDVLTGRRRARHAADFAPVSRATGKAAKAR
ncbi:hypothetical protein [Methylobacterium sp. Leaf89]|uniref:hypothetical protein n=1 Tax=Methylobacterium sp. Leaf89 TaxID=1736245 RepID=UPI0006F700FA|nr:hypothetical protein [Methylobacterium sp. Leaf89]KQO73446.1 hypothetical protein ASF18_16775 [Methylobacterium sp. Leaf89]